MVRILWRGVLLRKRVISGWPSRESDNPIGVQKTARPTHAPVCGRARHSVRAGLVLRIYRQPPRWQPRYFCSETQRAKRCLLLTWTPKVQTRCWLALLVSSVIDMLTEHSPVIYPSCLPSGRLSSSPSGQSFYSLTRCPWHQGKGRTSGYASPTPYLRRSAEADS